MERFDIGRAFKAPFEDSEWVSRTLMGFLWSILVVTSPAVYGAQLEYIRRVSRGDERLPEWDDFGTKWVEGVLVAVAGFIYFLPVLLAGGILVVPGLIAAVSEGDADLVGGMLGGGMCLFTLLATVYSVALSVFFSAAMTHFAMKRSFGAFFEFGAISDKVRGGTGYFTAWIYVLLISFALSTVTGFIGGITGGLGSILAPAASYLAAMMMGHVLGQWAQQAYGSTLGGGATPAYGAPIEPPAPPAPPVDVTPSGPES